jgi:hypothetical protein
VLFGRSIQLWTNLVQAIAAAVVAGAAWMGNSIPAAVVATVVALVLATLGLLANQSVTGTMLGRKP